MKERNIPNDTIYCFRDISRYKTLTLDSNTHLNVGKNGLEVTELDRRGRLTGPSRSWGRHWYSWSCSRPEAYIFIDLRDYGTLILTRSPKILAYFIIESQPRLQPNKCNYQCMRSSVYGLSISITQILLLLCELSHQHRHQQPWTRIYLDLTSE